MSHLSHSLGILTAKIAAVHRIVLPALLLALLMTQAASSVCQAQCVQHQLPGGSANHGSAMTHCHSMLKMRPEANGATVQALPACIYSLCAIDLLANSPGKHPVQARPLAVDAGLRTDGVFFGLNQASFISAYRMLRSSAGSSPLITALRV